MIYLRDLSRRFGSKLLFEGLNLHLRPREKVGLVGENGAGKSTLFKIIAGQEQPDEGQVDWKKGVRSAMLTQELEQENVSALERALSGLEPYYQVRRDKERCEADEAWHRERPDEWGRRLAELENEFQHLGGSELEARAKKILQGLGFKSGEDARPLKEFSGGWRMRVELARLLLQAPDLLLLDEPTNHLDLRSVVWLESFLKSYEGALLLISHDRRFLNALVGRIAELDRGVLTVYTGNYDRYETEKAAKEERLAAEALNQGKRIAEIERFVERFRAKNTKAKQVQSRVKMLDKMERVQVAQQSKSVHFRFPQPPRTGRMVVRLTNVGKSYGAVEVYRDFSIELERGWRIALVGENGAGKSTLLKLMAGVLDTDSGQIELGSNVSRGYYSQHHSDALDPNHTVMESMEEVARGLTRTEKQNMLGAFLFSGDDVQKKVSVLSGGERSRLALARLLAFPSPVLFLDEPTNHLDMKTCEILAAALADFDGTLCVISHDRFFLDAIIDRVWEVDGGGVKEYSGNYSEFEAVKAIEAERALALKADRDNQSVLPGGDKERKRREAESRNQRYRTLKPLESQLSRVEAELERVMDAKSDMERELASPDMYEDSQKERLRTLLQRCGELDKEETALQNEWTRLTEQIEQLEQELMKEA